jgi:hypothetical protein
MILAIDAWIYSKLSAIQNISVDYWYPNSFTILPVLAYRSSQRTSDMDYQDSKANYVDATVELDLYTSDGTDDTATTQSIEAIMEGLLFNMDENIPFPDPDTKIRHRHLTYTRQGIETADLI